MIENTRRVAERGRGVGPVPPVQGERIPGSSPEPLPLDQDGLIEDETDADIAALDQALDALDRSTD